MLLLLFFLIKEIAVSFFFFFSSRRRHTRCLSDWSSDVCSSDLKPTGGYSDATVNLSLDGRAKAINAIIGACEKEGVVGAGFHHANGAAVGFGNKHGNFDDR